MQYFGLRFTFSPVSRQKLARHAAILPSVTLAAPTGPPIVGWALSRNATSGQRPDCTSTACALRCQASCEFWSKLAHQNLPRNSSGTAPFAGGKEGTADGARTEVELNRCRRREKAPNQGGLAGLLLLTMKCGWCLEISSLRQTCFLAESPKRRFSRLIRRN